MSEANQKQHIKYGTARRKLDACAQNTCNIHVGNLHLLVRVTDQTPVMQCQLSPQAPIT